MDFKLKDVLIFFSSVLIMAFVFNLMTGKPFLPPSWTGNSCSVSSCSCNLCSCSDKCCRITTDINALKHSIVLVGYITKIDENNDTPNYVWIGSGGVIVRNNRVYVLTAQHVTEFVANLKKKLVIGVPKALSNDGKIVPFEVKILVVGHPEGFDLEKSFLDFTILEVLCNYQEIKKYFSHSLILSREVRFKENDDTLLIGNMLADYAELSVSLGRINKVGAEWPKYHIYADYASLPGTSGSPVFDKNGRVVGVHVASLGGRVSLFVDINVIRCEAEKQGYGFLWED